MIFPAGREEIIKNFSNMIKEKHLGHAYLVCGPKGYGKKTLLAYLLHLIMCEKNTACLRCNQCLTVSSGANPDVKLISNQDKASIGIDKIRELIKDVYIKPVMGEKKIIVIENAHLLTAGAQNALLKVIEEPPSYAVFFLLCDNVSTILPTVLSRVAKINLSPLSEEKLKEIVPGLSPFLYHYCGGNIGELLRLKDDETFSRLRGIAIDAVMSLSDSDSFSMYKACQPLEKDRKKTVEIMDLMLMFVRDIILDKNGLDKMIVNEDKINEIKTFSSLVNRQKCLKIAECIQSFQKKLGKSGNLSMATQTMFVKCREVIHG
jgi:DNA polymerase-3 subunit delta'